MNGPQHYREAEGFLDSAAYLKEEGDLYAADQALRRALVHATLAQAAAVAELDSYSDPPGTGRPGDCAQAWKAVFDS